VLVCGRARGDRTARGGARPVRARAGQAQPSRPAVGGPGVRRRAGLGQFPADLFTRRPDHRGNAAEPALAGGHMSRLVVVSNRVALPGQPMSGGLAVALRAALEETGGLWFGWSGKIHPKESGDVHEQQDGNIDYVTLDLSRQDHADYYNGFANRTLWPLLYS